jgi:regulator of replication initiation timing|tara:strand:+ start:180 stop:644 length:465 start_codon:yes stop_codon:yes gene_type:complete
MSRLANDNYERPKKTLQDKLTPEDIKDKLKEYIEVEDIGQVSLNTHLRYFTEKIDEKTKKKTKAFRLGGFLVNKNNYEKYIILSNVPDVGGVNPNKKTWSVNTQKSIFYRKLSNDEIKDEYQEEIDELYEEINVLKKELKKVKAENSKLKKLNK